MDLVRKVWEAGVVGAGGAGFPTWKKIDAQVDTVIANGAECEPLLRNDRNLMAARAKDVVRGMELVISSMNAKEGIIGLKKKYAKAVAAFKNELKGRENIRLHLLNSVYPAGDEFVLVYEVTGKVVPEQGIPLDVGVVVSNVETFANIAAAADKGASVISRFVTVTGAVKEPKTVIAPIGMPLSELIAAAGGTHLDDYVILTGGPMMGTIENDPATPVSKTTTSIIILPPDNPTVVRKTRPLSIDINRTKAMCCQCNYCTMICPRAMLGHSLKPHIIMRSINLGLPSPATNVTMAALCCNCDLCGVYSCPMCLPVGRINVEITDTMSEMGWKPAPRTEEPSPHPMREYRLVPVSRLTMRLGLSDYDRDAPLDSRKLKTGRVRIPLKQHIGKPAAPIVKKGDTVKAGQLIGDLEWGTMGARVHASINGVVARVDDEVIIEAR
ncbi:MAG: SLBB domain-containing protein [Candidatus Tritonobacter lacicola]|nr:SLBB domain-containing protein [Candidatus Tritonobacter lacicola]